MRLVLRIVAVCLSALMGLVIPGQAQAEVRAAFTANQGSPLIGEPVQLTLTVAAPADAVVTLPTFALDWPPLMVTNVGKVSQTTSGGQTLYRLELTVILWQPGDYQTPETFVEYRRPNSSKTFRQVVEPAFFAVPSVLKPDDLALRPLKPPAALPYVAPWLVLVGGGGVAVVGIGVGVWLRKRRRRVPAAEMSGDLTAMTLRELRRLETLPASRAYDLLGEALRKYIEARFGVSAGELTSAELLTALSAHPQLNEGQWRDLKRILEHLDLVKFAQLRPEANAMPRLIRAAQWVENTSRQEKAVTV
ncbi:MAG TPA: hypothetical protein VHO69_19300 [Phototrophicaceae bacterium]|nr:hypothetical protein [Phototrophicaceae bacterium]